ncbi:MAG: hypothetical protein R3F11_17410 [Verrucomicrobiales bacterium]
MPSLTLIGLAAALAVSGCVTVDQLAPPTSALPGAGGGNLALGRQIYVTKCAKCHAVEPVKKYSRAEWAEIMPEMAEETKLNAAETAAVTAYVEAVLAMP